jgi:pimeloyl-ACP methyl ester carboxylesterase
MVARDRQPTGVSTEDYWLRFRVPPGLMPDPQFDGRRARIRVHRVRPVYANGQRPQRAAVLIHGRTVPGPVVFDLRDPATGGGTLNLSVQKRLAQAGIDTFAPSLLGYGRSTRFREGLNDPGNASLSACPTAGPSPPEGCDRTLNQIINPYDQQDLLTGGNPLTARRAHSSKFRFARTDVWVRDIDQVIDDAIERARPRDRKIALVGYSLGGQHVGRTLYADNPNEQLLYADDNLNEDLHNRDKVIEKVSRVVFLNSFFGARPDLVGMGPTEELDPFGPPTFPLLLDNRAGSDALWTPVNPNPQACPGRIIDGTKEQVWRQTMEHETVGREWGTTGGLNRAPTFSGYGWNRFVARKLRTPTLVMQGLEDGVLPTGPGTGRAIYGYLPAPEENVFNKVLVEVECASHVMQWEGCDGGGFADCTPPYVTFQEALIEWIKSGTFNGNANGPFYVNPSAESSAAT